MKKNYIKYLITNFFVFLFALGLYYNLNIQYYFKFDLRQIGFSNPLYSILQNQNRFIITEKIFKDTVIGQEIKIQNVKISREQILVFFKKKKSLDLNNFLDEELNLELVFEFLLKERIKDFKILDAFLKDIGNPPDTIINEIYKFSLVTKELETLKNYKNVFSYKISQILHKNPTLLDMLIFSITYLLISSVLILNNKKIRKFIS